MTDDQALSHLRVLDLTHYIAGPYCTRLLASYGAEVIKVERPGQGDPTRRMAPFLKDRPHPEKSGTFLHLNLNKRGVTLNLKSAAGSKIFLQLLQWADIVVESFRPGAMDRLGFSYARLSAIKPEIVVTSISNFGQTGPYRDYKATDLIEFAIGGPMLFTGTREREPVKLARGVGMYFAGQMAAVATLVAANRQQENGQGDHIDISIMETQAGSIDRQTALLVNYQYTGVRRSRSVTSQAYLGGIYKCADGYLDLRARERLSTVANMLEVPELLEESSHKASGNPGNPDLVESLDQMLREWLSQRTRQEAWQVAQQHRVLAAPLYNMEDVSKDHYLRGRGLWTTVERPQVGALEHIGRSFLMQVSPWRLTRSAPLLGQHNQEVYCDMLGYSKEDLARLRQMGAI